MLKLDRPLACWLQEHSGLEMVDESEKAKVKDEAADQIESGAAAASVLNTFGYEVHLDGGNTPMANLRNWKMLSKIVKAFGLEISSNEVSALVAGDHEMLTDVYQRLMRALQPSYEEQFQLQAEAANDDNGVEECRPSTMVDRSTAASYQASARSSDDGILKRILSQHLTLHHSDVKLTSQVASLSEDVLLPVLDDLRLHVNEIISEDQALHSVHSMLLVVVLSMQHHNSTNLHTAAIQVLTSTCQVLKPGSNESLPAAGAATSTADMLTEFFTGSNGAVSTLASSLANGKISAQNLAAWLTQLPSKCLGEVLIGRSRSHFTSAGEYWRFVAAVIDALLNSDEDELASDTLPLENESRGSDTRTGGAEMLRSTGVVPALVAEAATFALADGQTELRLHAIDVIVTLWSNLVSQVEQEPATCKAAVSALKKALGAPELGRRASERAFELLDAHIASRSAYARPVYRGVVFALLEHRCSSTIHPLLVEGLSSLLAGNADASLLAPAVLSEPLGRQAVQTGGFASIELEALVPVLVDVREDDAAQSAPLIEALAVHAVSVPSEAQDAANHFNTIMKHAAGAQAPDTVCEAINEAVRVLQNSFTAADAPNDAIMSCAKSIALYGGRCFGDAAAQLVHNAGVQRATSRTSDRRNNGKQQRTEQPNKLLSTPSGVDERRQRELEKLRQLREERERKAKEQAEREREKKRKEHEKFIKRREELLQRARKKDGKKVASEEIENDDHTHREQERTKQTTAQQLGPAASTKACKIAHAVAKEVLHGALQDFVSGHVVIDHAQQNHCQRQKHMKPSHEDLHIFEQRKLRREAQREAKRQEAQRRERKRREQERKRLEERQREIQKVLRQQREERGADEPQAHVQSEKDEAQQQRDPKEEREQWRQKSKALKAKLQRQKKEREEEMQRQQEEQKRRAEEEAERKRKQRKRAREEQREKKQAAAAFRARRERERALAEQEKEVDSVIDSLVASIVTASKSKKPRTARHRRSNL